MSKITLDMNTFKALASDSRLDILRALDGKKLSLKDISIVTSLNKATLHEHLIKLNEAGLVKKYEREGHKWVYYKLSWKGEGLLHPENNRIVVLFTTTLITLFFGIIQMINYVKGYIVGKAVNFIGSDSTVIYPAIKTATGTEFAQAPIGNVPILDQTTSELSRTLVGSTAAKDILGNTLKIENIGWQSEGVNLAYLGENGVKEVYNKVFIDPYGSEEIVTNVPQSLIAIYHDPNIQIIAIALFTICGILVSIGFWRIWKNKKQKL
jgi:DNA-binding transcriptional ArsR family regulator